MNKLATKEVYGTKWFYKTCIDPKLKPKQEAIDNGKKLGHTLFVERQEGKANHRLYGSYESVEQFVKFVKTTKRH